LQNLLILRSLSSHSNPAENPSQGYQVPFSFSPFFFFPPNRWENRQTPSPRGNANVDQHLLSPLLFPLLRTPRRQGQSSNSLHTLFYFSGNYLCKICFHLFPLSYRNREPRAPPSSPPYGTSGNETRKPCRLPSFSSPSPLIRPVTLTGQHDRS